MWERRGVEGGGGVIYAEQALLPLPPSLPARRSEPPGAQGASRRAIGARASRGGTRPLRCTAPVRRLGRLLGGPGRSKKRQAGESGSQAGLDPAAEGACCAGAGERLESWEPRVSAAPGMV